MYYLKDVLNIEKFQHCLKVLIFDDGQMRENSMEEIIRRVESTFMDKSYLAQVATSRQRWIDEDIEIIAQGIVSFLKNI